MSRYLSFKCDHDLYIEFYSICSKQGKSISECLRESVTLYIEHYRKITGNEKCQ